MPLARACGSKTLLQQNLSVLNGMSAKAGRPA